MWSEEDACISKITVALETLTSASLSVEEVLGRVEACIVGGSGEGGGESSEGGEGSEDEDFDDYYGDEDFDANAEPKPKTPERCAGNTRGRADILMCPSPVQDSLWTPSSLVRVAQLPCTDCYQVRQAHNGDDPYQTLNPTPTPPPSRSQSSEQVCRQIRHHWQAQRGKVN